MALIEIKGLERTFQQGEIAVRALRGIDLRVEQGEFAALVGPSGSGKTTLLNCIGGLDWADAGHLVVAGKDLTIMNVKERNAFRLQHIGFVFQSYNLLPILTALENTEYVLLIQGKSKTERHNRAMQILEEIGLADLANRFPGQLSGGQQQRVAVARALVTRPDLVLADEPTANLDSENADRLLDLMQEMCQKRETTFLFSTHDERVMRRASRLLPLRDGQLTDVVQK